MDEAGQTRWFRALRAILDRSHLWTTEDVARTVHAAMQPLGLSTRIWLVDYEQAALRPLPEPGRETPEPVPVDGSLAGRAFARVESAADAAGHRWWVPMVDATDRLGAIEFAFSDGADDPEALRHCELVAGLVGHLIATVSERGDHIDGARRSQPMSAASELLWRLVPPLTSSTGNVVVSAVLEPCYDVGGDGFDYALDGAAAQLMILDAVGRGLRASLACAVALAATRAARRAGRGLYDQARAADAALIDQFPDSRFATAVLADLDVDTGRLRYINAGHPAPLLLRRGRAVRHLDEGRRMPLGLDDAAVRVAEVALEPGDRLLLYTDGVTEARTPDGERFGVGHLVELVERHERDGLPAPETLRRLAHAVVDHQAGPPSDDATLMMVQWSTPAALATVPKAGQRREEGNRR
jgi:hypothetical protein